MKPDLSDFPNLGNETMSHIELRDILEKVADWKAVFEKQLQEKIGNARLLLRNSPANTFLEDTVLQAEIAILKEILGVEK